MKLIKRLKHTDTEMTDAIIGWDWFRCGDYSVADAIISSGERNFSKMRSAIKIGHTLIIALNLGPIKFFKRSFIKI